LAEQLRARAIEINPMVEATARPGQRTFSVSIETPAGIGDISVASLGWWAGFGGRQAGNEEVSPNPLGAGLAGILAFTTVFNEAFADLLRGLVSPPTSAGGWSLFDFSARPAQQS